MVCQKHLLYTFSKSYISTIEHKKNASIFFGVGGATKKDGVRDSRRRRRRRDRGRGRDVTKRDEDEDRVARCVL